MEQKHQAIEIILKQCILCRMCEITCPEKVITVDKTTRTWSIDHSGCTLCSACIQACPRDALTLGDAAGPSWSGTVPAPLPTKRKAAARAAGRGKS